MLWQIASFPRCEHHVFLSHCREDHDALVRPVYDAISAAGASAWLDREDYYYGRDSRAALRDAVLRSRHVAFFVTDAMLSTGRGWCVFELAFAELLQANLQDRGGALANVFLPLFLVPQSDERLPRTVWQAVRDRGRFYDPTADTDLVAWCVREVRDFLLREQKLARESAVLARQDKAFARQAGKVPGMFDRVARFHPRRLTAG